MFKASTIVLTILVWLTAAAAAQPVRFDDVVRNLRNPDPRARLSSLSMLREAKYLEAIDPIAPLVNDPVDEVQLAAIETELSFYLVEDVNQRRRMAFIVEVRNSGRAETAFASGPLAVWPRPVPAALSLALLRAVDDENPKVRIESIYTFGAIAQAPVSSEQAALVIQALDHYDPAVREAAARVAGRLRITTAGDALITAVNDSQAPVRFAAMRALGEVRELRAVQALAEQLEHYRKGEGAWSALDALAHIGHGSSVAVFKARLTDRDAFMRRAAVEGLGRARASAEIPAIEALLNDSSEMVRVAALFALQTLGRDAIPQLASALRSSDLAPQISGYFLELGAPAASGLAAQLKNPSASVRGNAALIVGAIGGEPEVAALEPLLQDRNADVRRAGDRAIRRIKVRGA